MIVQSLPEGRLGQTVVDGVTSRILIEADTADVYKHLILFHELVHIAEEKLLLGRLIKTRSPEQYVSDLAATLFGITVTSGSGEVSLPLTHGSSPQGGRAPFAAM